MWGVERVWGLEICKKRPNISILVAFVVRTFAVGGEGGEKAGDGGVNNS